jgi:hypothetical protein
MARPTAFELFCLYHLGLSPDFEAKFYNLQSIAKHFGVAPGEVQKWLDELNLSPDLFPHIRYNVAVAHAKAQEVAMFEGPDAARAFARSSFEEFVDALQTYDPGRRFEDVDYDDIWGDRKKRDGTQ